jgi:hypothetical protein
MRSYISLRIGTQSVNLATHRGARSPGGVMTKMLKAALAYAAQHLRRETVKRTAAGIKPQ